MNKPKSVKTKLFYHSVLYNRGDFIGKKKYKDIEIGDIFGYLTVIESLGRYPDKRLYYKCLCKCGNTVIVRKENLNNGNTQSCGCLRYEIVSKNSRKDWTNTFSPSGIKFIKPYSVIGRTHKERVMWECECFCGNRFVALPAKIMSNHTKSCGCIKNSRIQQLAYDFVKSMNYTVKTEHNCTLNPIMDGRKLRYDIEIVDLKLIIEVMGQQHYNIDNYFILQEATKKNTSKEDVFFILQKTDEFKKQYAIENSYHYLSIPYWEFDKNEKYKNTITEMINNIVNTEVTQEIKAS